MVTSVKPIGGGSMKSRKLARKVTASYHTIKNELTMVEKSNKLTASEKKRKVTELEERLENIGGIDAYQEASIISTQHFKTSRWVLNQISTHLTANDSKRRDKLKVLEIGAINIQLQQVSHLDVRSIDINSQDARIEEIDFFHIPPENNYDVVVCSMVVNCVHDAKKRGEMLLRLRHHLRNSDSILLLVLPLRCVHSKHVGALRLKALLDAIGFRLLERKESPRLIFYTLRRGEGACADAHEGRAHSDGQREVKDEAWRRESRLALKKNLHSELVAHFSQDFERVPPSHFCLSLEASWWN